MTPQSLRAEAVRTTLIARWEARRDELAKLKASVDGATLCEEILADLARLARTTDEELLDLPTAAQWSGYSADHLGRLIRAGKLPNAGRKHAPRIRLADLPRRPRGVATNAATGVATAAPQRYDPDTDARRLRGTR